MSEEHEPINLETYVLPKGKWRIHYYETNAIGFEPDKVIKKVHTLDMPTPLRELALEGHKILSCWNIT